MTAPRGALDLLEGAATIVRAGPGQAYRIVRALPASTRRRLLERLLGIAGLAGRPPI